jgi:thiamine-phosphate pyrophosphorylase
MVAQIYLVTPQDADATTFPDRLAAVLETGAVAAVLIARHEIGAVAYSDLCAMAIPAIQAAGAAALVADDLDLARTLGADGIHVSGGDEAVERALKAMKPQGIVGAGPVRTKHDAMALGEREVDYLFFGGIGHPANEDERTLAAWWAETFEIPAVLSTDDLSDAAGCEFVAPGPSVWADPAALLTAARGDRETV